MKIHEMTDGEIVAMLNAPNQRVPPQVRQFLAELLESFDVSEIPDVLRSLSRAEVALRGYPLDADLMNTLSWRELMTQTGVDVPDDFELPGVTDRVTGALDMRLADLNRKIGPFEFRVRLQEYSKKLDAKNGAALNEFAKRHAHAPP